MNIYFNYDYLNQRFDPPFCTQNRLDIQTLIPYRRSSNSAWCNYHKRWENVFINNYGTTSGLFFSCGMPLYNHIGLNGVMNLNLFSIEVDEQNMTFVVKKKLTYDEIHDNTEYHIKYVYAKCVDFKTGKIYFPAGFYLDEIPSFVEEQLDLFLLAFCKQIFGIEIKRNTSPINDFVKFPTCPNFAKLIPYIDNGHKYNFRNTLNLFKDFCSYMRIKETKKLRKAFAQDPTSLLVYAFCYAVGFTDSNAIQHIVADKEFKNRYTTPGYNTLRFSMVRREIYFNNSFFNYLQNYRCNLVDSLRLWVQNALTDKTQIIVAKRLLKFMVEEDYNIIVDSSEYYLRNARNLPIPLHERILQEGFTRAIHDQEMHLYRSGSTLEKIDIQYSETEKSFETVILNSELSDSHKVENKKFKKAEKNISSFENGTNEEEMKNLVTEEEQAEVVDFDQQLEMPEIKSSFDIARDLKKSADSYNDYYFILPKDTDELYEISENMRNCVGYLYRDKAINKDCTIVVMMHKNKFTACIELRQGTDYKYSICQLKGHMNREVRDDDLNAVILWTKKNISLREYKPYRY